MQYIDEHYSYIESVTIFLDYLDIQFVFWGVEKLKITDENFNFPLYIYSYLTVA